MKKYLFFDIDGTLFNLNKQLSQKTIASIHQAKENGHEIFIATGRAPFMIEEVLQKLKVDSYICFNGQYVVYKGELVSTKSLPTEQLQLVENFAEERNHSLVWMDEVQMVATCSDDNNIDVAISSLYLPYPKVDFNFKNEKTIYQALLFCEQGEEDAYAAKFPDLKFVRWHEKSVDILPGGGSKGEAIKELCEKLQIDLADTIAFGDGLNDVEMLQTVGIGVVMENGHEEAKKIAHIVTSHVDEDGLTLAMEKLELI